MAMAKAIWEFGSTSSSTPSPPPAPPPPRPPTPKPALHPKFTRFSVGNSANYFAISHAAMEAKIAAWLADLENKGMTADAAALTIDRELWNGRHERKPTTDIENALNGVKA